ncbi:MAG: hypothetical protein GY822_28450 [Deltaproteobacteria bacterium]|nr:hypothetical protein [Deltaproteobacteria bacterium]
MARSLLDDQCEEKDGQACLKLGEAFLEGSWLEKDESGVMDMYHELCDDDWTTSECSRLERGMRRAEIRVPGDRTKWPFQLRFHLLAAAGADSNPFATNQQAMVRDDVSEVFGFALLPEAVAFLAGDYQFGYGLGPLHLRVGGKLETTHMATLDKGGASTSGQLTLLSLDVKINIGASMSLGPIRLSVDDNIRFAQLPGRFMPISPGFSVPLLRSVRGGRLRRCRMWPGFAQKWSLWTS